MLSTQHRLSAYALATAALSLLLTLPAVAQPRLELNQILVGSLDQPRARAILRDTSGNVLDAPGLDILGGSGTTYTVEGFYDTGAGTILLGPTTAANFGLGTVPGATFADVGVGGLDFFDISDTIDIQLADYDNSRYAQLDNPATFNSVYNHPFSGVRAAVGPRGDHAVGADVDPIDQIINATSEFNVFGTPLMKDKLAVFDNRGLNALFETPGNDPKAIRDFTSLINLDGGLDNLQNLQLKTFIYDSPNAASPRPPAADQPAIPVFDAKIKTDYADFSNLTTTTGGAPPALAHNPFVGPAPALADENPNDGGQNLPGITITQGGVTTETSWLYDTGAAASIWSQAIAQQHGVFYSSEPGKGLGSNNPTLVDANGNELGNDDLPQFQLQIGGVGGTLNIAGFFVEELIVPAFRDDGHGGEEQFDMVFKDAPLLIADISIDATPDDLTDTQTFTLEGVLGMNTFAPSLFLSGLSLDPSALGSLPTLNSNFDLFAFDEPTGDVLLKFNPDLVTIPEPTAGLLLASLSLTLLKRRKG